MSTNRPVAQLLQEFHQIFGGVHTKTDDLWLRKTLQLEESKELAEALDLLADPQATDEQLQQRLQAAARELADVVFVSYGTALIAGIDLDQAVNEVHRSNLSKLGEDGKPLRREDGKILKGPNFKTPQMQTAISPDAVKRLRVAQQQTEQKDDLDSVSKINSYQVLICTQCNKVEQSEICSECGAELQLQTVYQRDELLLLVQQIEAQQRRVDPVAADILRRLFEDGIS